jgi:hypothetical protein
LTLLEEREMNLEEIRDEVKLIVQDDGFADESIDGYINQAYLDATSQLMLPSLKRLDTVVTDTSNAYVSVSALEGGFSGRLIRVYNSDGVSLALAPSLEVLMDDNGGLENVGDVETCCLEGNVLWYVKVPDVAVTLTILYFKNVDLLVGDSDIPSELPDFCHRSVLVHGAAAIMFDVFEDGVDGAKVNMQSHRGLSLDGLMKTREWLGRNKRHYISSCWSI